MAQFRSKQTSVDEPCHFTGYGRLRSRGPGDQLRDGELTIWLEVRRAQNVQLHVATENRRQPGS